MAEKTGRWVRGETRAALASSGRTRASTRLAVVTGSLLAFAAPAVGQSSASGKAGPRKVLDRDHETALALSAAPPAVSADASVLLWTGSTFETAREGTNGVTCYVAR
ncbi:MAG: hypothetical protein HKO53_08230, partial [Gemmatimonadetes bacterium]|nr:hypothetical protein [Gemmatimonadota bacterium]